MNASRSVAFATWMLEHVACDESLQGDLLEELRAGRSASWYWRESLSAIAVTITHRFRPHAQPLTFAVGWSLLYPMLWPAILSSRPTQSLIQRMSAHDLPYSSALHAISEAAPALLFVWIGFLFYLAAQRRSAPHVPMLRLLASLSIGLNILLLATIGVHILTSLDGQDVTPANFTAHIGMHLVSRSIPLALSLFAALRCALPQTRRRHRSSDPLAS